MEAPQQLEFGGKGPYWSNTKRRIELLLTKRALQRTKTDRRIISLIPQKPANLRPAERAAGQDLENICTVQPLERRGDGVTHCTVRNRRWEIQRL